MQHFYSFVSQVCHGWCPPFSTGHVAFLFMVCHCWCPPFSVGHVAFLCICLPGLSLLVSAVIGGVRPFRWPCNVSIHLSRRSVAAGVRPFHLSSRSVTAGVRPFPLAMQHFNSFVFKVIPLLLSPPLAMQHFYLFVFHVVCLLLFSRFGACTAGIRPFPLSSISIHLPPR